MSEAAPPPPPTLARLCAELIALRERNDRQHKLFEQSQAHVREDLQARFGQFAAETQAAYQRLRDELTGEKRQSLALLNAMLDVATDLDRLAAARPPSDGMTPDVAGWAEGVAVAARKAQALLAQFGVHRYEAVVGTAYRPELHERVGSAKMEGMEPQRVAKQVEAGYAAATPDFVLRRAKVLISE